MGVNGGESETSQLKLQTQYGNELSALDQTYQNSAAQVAQQVNTLQRQGEKQESDVKTDYYAKLFECIFICSHFVFHPRFYISFFREFAVRGYSTGQEAAFFRLLSRPSRSLA